MKVCKTCNTEKEVEEFSKGKGYKDGIRPHCIECRREYEVESYHKHKHKRPYDYETDKDRKLKATYGISYKEYKTMLEAQNGQCAICGTTSTGNRKAFHVDHDHETGEVRGLLCGNCNSGIGNLRDDIGLLKRAIQYLESTKKEP
jgi:hypothetical protein